MRFLGLFIALAWAGCAASTARPQSISVSGPRYSDPRAVLLDFVARVESGDFESAHRFLAEPLRARYTPARLREDFYRDPLAGDRIKALARAAGGAPLLDDRGASFRLDSGRAARLIREGSEYRISSLE